MEGLKSRRRVEGKDRAKKGGRGAEIKGLLRKSLSKKMWMRMRGRPEKGRQDI